MVKANLRLAGLVVVATTFAAWAVDAQQVISRTSDYTVTWSNSAFGTASALYSASYAYDASAFPATNFPFSILPNAQNFAYFQGGGVTVSSPAPTGPPYPSTATATFSGDGTLGYWGWQYDTAAGGTGSGLPLIYGRLGNLATLNFDVGGFDTSLYSPGIDYYVYVDLPGDWTTQGTSTGDYIFNGVASGFSAPTFTYIGGITTVETIDTDFTGGSPSLSFTLVGAAVPEFPTWAMLLLGFAGLGFVGHRVSRKSIVVAG